MHQAGTAWHDNAVVQAINLTWEASPIPSILISTKEFVVNPNPAAKQFFQDDFSNLAVKCLRAMGRRQFVLLQSAYHEAQNGSSQTLQNVGLKIHGKRLVVDLKFAPIKGPFACVAIFIEDRTEENLIKEENTFLCSLADHIKELMYVSDEDGRLVFLNKTTADVLGVSVEEAQGKLREQLMPVEAATQHSLTDQAALKAKAPLVRNEHLNILGVAHTYESLKFPIIGEASGRRLIGGISRDITRERQFNENVRFSEAIFHNARDAIALTSATGVALRVNRSFEIMTGFSNSTVRGLSMRILGVGSPTTDGLTQAMETAMHSGFWSGQLELRNADGTKLVAWARITLMHDDDNQPEGMMWIITDISDLRTAQDLRLAAERESKAKNEFLAMMSHELRTPLGGILGSMELVLDDADALPPRVLDRLQNIRSAGETLLQIVNDLLDMSRLQAGKVQLETSRFSLGHLMKQVCAISQVSAKSKGVDLELVSAGGPPIAYVGDRHRLAQILHNLIGNAIKFTPESGKVQIKVIGLDPLTFVISDTGIGMTQAERTRIFQAFEQADSTISRRFGGTGLGLTIVRSLVSLMGGTITIDSEKGKGTDVTVCLPLEISPTSAETIEAQAEETEELSSKSILAGVRVLVADDNFINRTILTSFLENTGATVISAEDGDQAVEQFIANPAQVLCLDISMPGRDGISALQAIKEHCSDMNLDTPKSIAVTANAMPQQQLEYLRVGFDSYISKPYTRDTVVRMIRDLASKMETEKTGA